MSNEAKKPSTDAETKIGVYVCHCGGNISDQVVVEQVAERAGDLPNVTVARRNMFMCSDPGPRYWDKRWLSSPRVLKPPATASLAL